MPTCFRTNLLLEGFCRGTDRTFFYTCLWECTLASTAVRLAAINFVLAHFNRKQSMEDQLYFIGTNIELMVSCCQRRIGCVNYHYLESILVFKYSRYYFERNATKIISINSTTSTRICESKKNNKIFFRNSLMLFSVIHSDILLSSFCLLPLQVESLCASVQDSSVLVQRSALEFLLLGFPLHHSQLTRPDMAQAMTASVKVLTYFTYITPQNTSTCMHLLNNSASMRT